MCTELDAPRVLEHEILPSILGAAVRKGSAGSGRKCNASIIAWTYLQAIWLHRGTHPDVKNFSLLLFYFGSTALWLVGGRGSLVCTQSLNSFHALASSPEPLFPGPKAYLIDQIRPIGATSPIARWMLHRSVQQSLFWEALLAHRTMSQLRWRRIVSRPKPLFCFMLGSSSSKNVQRTEYGVRSTENGNAIIVHCRPSSPVCCISVAPVPRSSGYYLYSSNACPDSTLSTKAGPMSTHAQ